MSSQTAQQCAELIEAQQQRLPSVKHDREARLLPSSLFDQPIAGCTGSRKDRLSI